MYLVFVSKWIFQDMKVPLKWKLIFCCIFEWIPKMFGIVNYKITGSKWGTTHTLFVYWSWGKNLYQSIMATLMWYCTSSIFEEF